MDKLHDYLKEDIYKREKEVEKRKYYIQTYSFTMLGFLIDENYFEVNPAVTRVVQLGETNKKIKKSLPKQNDINKFELNLLYLNSNTSLGDTFDYTADLEYLESTNVDSYDVYINGDFYGTDITKIQINTNDQLTITIQKPIDPVTGLPNLDDAKIRFKTIFV